MEQIFNRAKRGPQVILLKDLAIIAAYSGVESGDLAVDAGTGSGWLAMWLARIVGPSGKVVTYETRKEFIKIAEENFKKFGIKNIIIKNKDITKGIAEKNIDLVTLDLPEPWKVPFVKKLKQGGIVVAYLPQMTQVIQFCKFIKKQKLKLEKVAEIIERDWIVEGRIARPEHHMLGHTGFLVFARKV